MQDDNSIFSDIYANYKVNRKKKKLKIGDWVVVDEEFYLKYKDKLTITNIKLYNGQNETTKRSEKYLLAETKTEYIIIKYNSNFIAVNICEREYELTNSITLVMINDKSIYNIENNCGKPPEIKDLFKTLGWKLGRKAINNLEILE